MNAPFEARGKPRSFARLSSQKCATNASGRRGVREARPDRQGADSQQLLRVVRRFGGAIPSRQASVAPVRRERLQASQVCVRGCLWGPDIFVEARVEYAQGGLRRSTLGQCHLDELLYCFRSIRERGAGSRFTLTVWLQDGRSNDLPSTSTDDS
jgi:hypothetical protein